MDLTHGLDYLTKALYKYKVEKPAYARLNTLFIKVVIRLYIHINHLAKINIYLLLTVDKEE